MKVGTYMAAKPSATSTHESSNFDRIESGRFAVEESACIELSIQCNQLRVEVIDERPDEPCPELLDERSRIRAAIMPLCVPSIR
jgi:hypothetical protein